MKTVRAIMLVTMAFSVLGAASGCGGKPNGYGGSFAWHSLSVNYACETRPGQQDQVRFLVFCEDHPSETKFTDQGGTIKLSNGVVVKLSFAKNRQFWINNTGEVTVLEDLFTCDQVKKLADLSLALPDENIKKLEDIRALLDGNP